MLRRLYGIPSSPVILPESPPTLEGVLDLLHARYTGMRDRLCTADGRLREHILVFVGDRDAGRDPSVAPVPDGATVQIVPAISGGR
jgi:molybdopterin converting factor small subunit